MQVDNDSIRNSLFNKYHKQIYKYDLNKYSFINILKQIYNVNELQDAFKSVHILEPCNFNNDQHKIHIKQLYKSPLFEEFVKEYTKFIINEVRPLFKDETFIIYQTKPTFRIQYINDYAVGEWHRDTNPGYKHTSNEINFFMPFTELNEYNTIWMNKSMDDDRNGIDSTPILIRQGEFTSNYLAHIKHGNILNNSNTTRISIDFRVIPGSLYHENLLNNDTTHNNEMRLIVGEYFTKL